MVAWAYTAIVEVVTSSSLIISLSERGRGGSATVGDGHETNAA